MGRTGIALWTAAVMLLGRSASGATPDDPSTPGEAPGSTGTVVRAPRPREVGATSFRSGDAQSEAGNQGDALKAVQSLPGVARPAQGSADLVVWGAAPAETRVLVDGIEIPALFHLGGVRSVIAPGLVGRLELTPGAWGAENGRALGGLVKIETQRLPDSGAHGELAADPGDASAWLSLAPTDRLRAVVGGQIGFLDQVLGPWLGAAARDRFPLPQYWDAHAKGTVELGTNERLDALVLASSDRLVQSFDSGDPALAHSQTVTRMFVRAGLVYRHNSEEERASWTVTPFFGRDVEGTTLSWGSVTAARNIATWQYGLRAVYRAVVDPRVTFSTGFDGLASDARLSRTGSMTLPPREGDLFVFGQPPSDQVAYDDWRVVTANAGLFASADVTLGPLSLTPGLRLVALGTDGSRLTPRVAATPSIGYSTLEWELEPRIAASLSLGPRVIANAAAGLYHQAPDPADRSVVFGAPLLQSSRAAHVAAGLSGLVNETLSIEAVGFYKGLDNLVVRSNAPTPEWAEALVQDGEGRAYGGQLFVRQRAWRDFSGWIAYTFSRSERRGGPGADWRLFDLDQTHALTISATQTLGAWRFGARLRWATGYPRTPVVGAYGDARRDLYEPVFGTQNSSRLPDFLQVDLDADHAFRLGPSANLHVFLEILNVTNHRNAEELVYSSDYAQRGYLTGLPVFATVGARLEL